ncbi:MAG: hypothetical protein KHZ05_05515 [Oscillospiraceae bacterium]|nr:hypothetical protein [Oscillospiraceae bacterium]
MTDLVQVQFRSRYGSGYSGAAYTYRADVPLSVGDVVTVPTKWGDSEARVCRVDVPEEEVAKFHGELRHITEPATPGGGLFDDFFK